MAPKTDMQEIYRKAEQLFPTAVLYLGSRTEARSAVTEALAAAARSGEEDALTRLLRICRTRASEQPDADLFDAGSPLETVMKLPAGSRRNIGLAFSGISGEEAADALGLTSEEYAQKLDKALRQLTFMQSGEQPDPDALKTAVGEIRLTDAEADAVCQGVQQAEREFSKQQASVAADTPARGIVRTDGAVPQRKTVPVWGVVLSILCVLLAGTVAGLLMDRRHMQQQSHAVMSEEEPEPYTVQDLSDLHYISMDEARAAALADTGLDRDTVTFTNTKLDTGNIPVSYKVVFVGEDAVQYEYTLDAESGEILKSQTLEIENPLNTSDWIPLDEMRAKALAVTQLDSVLILREQLGRDGDRGYYKFAFQDAHGKVYTVQLGAKDGTLLRYTVETPEVISTDGFITLETAKQQAVSRVGDLSADQVVFTKEKLDGAVYLISFTLDDGTQYALELDAKTGMTNTLDVHPVSADTSRAIGLLAARDIALKQADISAEDVQLYTKAKIDRSNGAYVYELEFESAEYEYEATLDMESGEILKYRAWYK